MASHQLDVLRVPGSIPGVAKIFHSLFDKSPQALMYVTTTLALTTKKKLGTIMKIPFLN